MRNNPKYGTALEYEELFQTQSKLEKFRRFFSVRRQKIFKHFTLQPYHTSFTYDKVAHYVGALDKFLLLEGKLVQHFKVDENIERPANNLIGFDRFYEALQKWGVNQTAITYDELTAVEKSP